MKSNNLTEKKERVWYWDSIKFLMMLAVVVGHFSESMVNLGAVDIASLKLFIYAFHMPMFIFIFGIFYNEDNYKRKALSFLVTGYVFKLFLFFSKLIINGKSKFALFYDAGITWFLFVLMWYTLLGVALKKYDKRIVLAVSFVISLFTGYFKEIDDFLCLSRMLVFFPYFWLGTMINRNDLLEKIKKYRRYLWLPAVCVLLGWFALCYFRFDDLEILSHLFSGRNPFSKETNGMGCLYRLLTSAITLLTGAAILAVVPMKKIPVISYLGRNTLNVYFWHYTFLYLVFRVLNVKEIIGERKGILLMLAIAVVLTFILSLDIFNFPLKNISKFIMSYKKKSECKSQHE